MVVGRIIGWVFVLIGLMVEVRDALVWFDTGHLYPLSLSGAWTLVGYFGRFLAHPVEGALAAIWAAPVLLAIGIALLVLCRRRPRPRRLFG